MNPGASMSRKSPSSLTRKRLNPELRGEKTELLRERLFSRVVGQNEAIEKIIIELQKYHAGLSPTRRPISNMLFLGPTGTGKTRTVEALAEILHDNPEKLLKIDCAEFAHSHEIAKLIGSPPGYLGHRETQPLLTDNRLAGIISERSKISLVLFDEIEKASDALWNLLLGILDKGILTLGDNRQVSFDKAMIFMTSNLGAREMKKLSSTGLGFLEPQNTPEALAGKMDKSAKRAVHARFNPEFINRLDQIITFQPLNEESISKILQIELNLLVERFIRTGYSLILSPSEEARSFLLKGTCDPSYGARLLKRTIERELVTPIATLIDSHQVTEGGILEVDVEEGKLVFDLLEK